MLKTFELTLSLPENEKANYSMGSIMHGALMEMLPRELGEVLHQQEMRPYSQSIAWDSLRQKAIWRICTLSDGIETAFLQNLNEGKNLLLHKKGYNAVIERAVCLQQTSFKELADAAFEGDVPSHVGLKFITPTAFKQAGGYVFFPDGRLILQNLLLRWNALCDFMKIEEDNLADKLSGGFIMTRYHLLSTPFSLEGRYLTGFEGQAHFHLGGNDAVRRLVALLISFAPFSGIGIKTALGMGAVEKII